MKHRGSSLLAYEPVNCPWCSGAINDDAAKCMWCGEWVDTKTQRRTQHTAGPIFRVAFIVLLIFVAWLFVLGPWALWR